MGLQYITAHTLDHADSRPDILSLTEIEKNWKLATVLHFILVNFDTQMYVDHSKQCQHHLCHPGPSCGPPQVGWAPRTCQWCSCCWKSHGSQTRRLAALGQSQQQEHHMTYQTPPPALPTWAPTQPYHTGHWTNHSRTWLPHEVGGQTRPWRSWRQRPCQTTPCAWTARRRFTPLWPSAGGTWWRSGASSKQYNLLKVQCMATGQSESRGMNEELTGGVLFPDGNQST